MHVKRIGKTAGVVVALLSSISIETIGIGIALGIWDPYIYIYIMLHYLIPKTWKQFWYFLGREIEKGFKSVASNNWLTLTKVGLLLIYVIYESEEYVEHKNKFQGSTSGCLETESRNHPIILMFVNFRVNDQHIWVSLLRILLQWLIDTTIRHHGTLIVRLDIVPVW